MATITSLMLEISRKKLTDFSKTVSSPKLKNCLGIEPPKRLLFPAAGIITVMLFLGLIGFNFLESEEILIFIY